MNVKPIKNNSQMLYLQAKNQFDQAMKKFEDGSIKSEPALIQTVFQSFQDFFTSLGKPNMIPRYATEDGPPWSEDYNNMMDEIKNDLELLYQEVDILGKSLYTDFNYNVMQHDILQKEYEEVYDKLRDLEIYTGFSKNNISFARDDFLNRSKIDYDKITGIPLDISGGHISLPTKSDPINLAQNAKVTIVTGNRKYEDFIIGADSNGFPGNNSEVAVIADPTISNIESYQFIGRENNHGDYGAVIDGNPNTWFEYERVNVRDFDKIQIAKNLGWRYQVHDNQTLVFAEDPENGVLKLHLQIVLEEKAIINQIIVNMYTPPNYGAKTAVIKNILVSDGVQAPRSIISDTEQNTDYTFTFDPIEAKVISILFEQDTKYFTDIGHIYYEKKMNTQNVTDYVFDTITNQYKPKNAPRIDGPLINIESLGVKVEVGENEINTYYPMRGGEETEYNLDNIVSELYARIDHENVDMGIERFEGWRYCIGIRDISILSCEYEKEAELVTTPYYFDQPIDKISISADETLGDLFTNNPSIKYDWVTYYISIDDGDTWFPITPIEHEMLEDSPPKIYTIHQVDESGEELNQYGYIESKYPVYSIRLKIVVTRPDDEVIEMSAFANETGANPALHAYATPTVHGYTFHVETQQNRWDSQASTRVAKGNNYLNNTENSSSTENTIPYDPNDPFRPDTDKDGIPDDLDNDDDNDGIPDDLDSTPKGDQNQSNNDSNDDSNNTPGNDSGNSDEDNSGSNDDSNNNGSTQNTLKIIFENPPTAICDGDDLIISGVIDGTNPITEKTLFLNNVIVDPNNLGEPPVTKTTSESEFTISESSSTKICESCMKKNTWHPNQMKEQTPLSTTFYAMSVNEESFYWVIPSWKLKELGIMTDDIIDVKVIAGDGDTITEAHFACVVEECSDEQPKNTCYELDTIIVRYYNEDFQDIQEIEIATNLLPYEFDNGEGTKVTVAWNNNMKAAVLMVTGGNNQSGAAFQVHGVGIRYNDLDNNSKIKWGINVSAQSEHNRNTDLMPGNPDEKSTSWVDDIHNGNYSTAPSLGGLNDWIMMSFDNDWVMNSCGFDQNFNPEENLVDPNPPENPDREKIRDCLDIKKITFQHYNDATGQLDIYQIGLGSNYKAVYPITGLNGSMELLVGWYNLFNGPLLNLRRASNHHNLLLTALGIIYEDEYGDLQTKWIDEIQLKTSTVQHSELMIGNPKDLSSLSWVNEVQQGNYDNAPFLGDQGATIIGKVTFDEPICAVENPIDNRPEMPIIDTTPPTITEDTIPSTICYSDLQDNKYHLTGNINDDHALKEWKIQHDADQWTSSTFADGTTQAPFDIWIPINVPAPSVEDGKIPDSSTVVIIDAWDETGNHSNKTIVLNFTDCNPVETTPPPSQDEQNITNSYDLLFRLRWGYDADGCDLDFHAFIDKDPSKHLYYDSGKVLEGTHRADYVNPDGKMYLNADYASLSHNTSSSWENEYELITIEGFAGHVLTLVVDRYNNTPITSLDRDPQVEIVNAVDGQILQTIVLERNIFTSRSMIVCDINLKGPGQTTLGDITVRKENRSSATPI